MKIGRPQVRMNADLLVGRDPDGEPNLDIYLTAEDTLFFSISPSDSISWAGCVGGIREHGVVRDEKLGQLLFALLDKIAALDPEDKKETV